MLTEVASALGKYSASKVITIEENVPDKVGVSWITYRIMFSYVSLKYRKERCKYISFLDQLFVIISRAVSFCIT